MRRVTRASNNHTQAGTRPDLGLGLGLSLRPPSREGAERRHRRHLSKLPIVSGYKSDGQGLVWSPLLSASLEVGDHAFLVVFRQPRLPQLVVVILLYVAPQRRRCLQERPESQPKVVRALLGNLVACRPRTARRRRRQGASSRIGIAASAANRKLWTEGGPLGRLL